MSVCLLHGNVLWDEFFIAALRDTLGNVTTYVGVQCKVSDEHAATICKKQSEINNDSDQDQDIGDENSITPACFLHYQNYSQDLNQAQWSKPKMKTTGLGEN